MKFVKIFWKKNVQDAYLPKISISEQIVSEIHVLAYDSIQILLNLLNLTWVLRLDIRAITGLIYQKQFASQC